MGVQMKEVEIPDFPYGALTNTIGNGEAASVFEELIRSGKVDQLADKRQIAGMKASLELPAIEYLKAMRIRTIVQEAFRSLFLDVDLLLTPTRLAPASKITEPLDRTTEGPQTEVAWIERADSCRESVRAAGDFIAVRVCGQNADRDFIRRAAVV